MSNVDQQRPQPDAFRAAASLTILRQVVPRAITSLRAAFAEPSINAREEAKILYDLYGWFAFISRDHKKLGLGLAICRRVSSQAWQFPGFGAATSATELLFQLMQRIVAIAEIKAWISNTELDAAISEANKAAAALDEAVAGEAKKDTANADVWLTTGWRAAQRTPRVEKARRAHEKAVAAYEAIRNRPRSRNWRFEALLANWPAIRDELSKLRLPDEDALNLCQAEAQREFDRAMRLIEVEQGRPAAPPAESEDNGRDGTPSAKSPKREPMRSLGERNYAVGPKIQAVEENEDSVLQAFFQRASSQGRWIALDQESLRNESGYQTAPRILKGIKKKYQLFASAIDCPGKKGRGGLKIYAIDSKKHRKK